jgi:hypothetical protein
VTDLDIEDVNVCHRSIFVNLKNVHLEFNVFDQSRLEMQTESQTIKLTFERLLHFIRNKPSLQHTSLSVSIDNMELLLFEQFVDSLTDFLRKFKSRSHVFLTLKHSIDYSKDEFLVRRWQNAWAFLRELVLLNDFSLRIEKLNLMY